MSQFKAGNNKAMKISDSDVVNLKKDYMAGMTQSMLCAKYNISIGQVGRIVRGESRRAVQIVASEVDLMQSANRLMALQEEMEKRKNFDKAAEEEQPPSALDRMRKEINKQPPNADRLLHELIKKGD